MTDHIVNVEQAEEWDGREGDHWVQHADRYDALSQRITPHLLDAGAVGAADRVLDVGCGCGLTSRAAAHAASAGSVLGVDLSAAMLQEAERRARAEGLTNVRFEQGDVQVHAFSPAAFDLAISRFGVMFFEDPVAAFANVASAIRPGGRFVSCAGKTFPSTIGSWCQRVRRFPMCRFLISVPRARRAPSRSPILIAPVASSRKRDSKESRSVKSQSRCSWATTRRTPQSSCTAPVWRACCSRAPMQRPSGRPSTLYATRSKPTNNQKGSGLVRLPGL